MNTLDKIMPSFYPLGKPTKKIFVQYRFGENDGPIRVSTTRDIERDFMNSGRDLLGLPMYHDDDDYMNEIDNELSHGN